jgi:hypothetical protein
VVARHVEQRDVEAADQVLEIVEGQVAAAQDQVGPDLRQALAVETFIDLVGDGEDAQLYGSRRA